jgi:hypothetical protein
LVCANLGMTWRDGSNLTEIEAARERLIRDMKTLEGIAPESGAYLNEVRVPRLFTIPQLSFFCFKKSSSHARRLRDTNSTGRNPSSVLTTISSEPSSRNTIQTLCSSFTKVSDQTSGMQISSARSDTAPNYYPAHWHWLSEESMWSVFFGCDRS